MPLQLLGPVAAPADAAPPVGTLLLFREFLRQLPLDKKTKYFCAVFWTSLEDSFCSSGTNPTQPPEQFWTDSH